ncbi:putative DNA-binding WRKY domain-containing protein [Rosellinia necatrix]|uniref:Putative DNA-binding WRKY domain-containing protein n=1 Tax=Rosellinia necatrix TaxID=77044 RepID=A0A1S7UN92_ROSNE|nr:putative DNA-binding WRKY domain-containing protein [Rosellinia necatrix]
MAANFWMVALFASFATVYPLARFARNHRSRSESRTWVGPGRPLLFPCQITHTQHLTRKHVSETSELLVGTPGYWNGRAGGSISVGRRVPSFTPWHTIDVADYLAQRHARLGCRDKVDEFLESQGVEASRYPYAYLVTAPNLTGCSWNSISFWYLYSAGKQLEAIVTEVGDFSNRKRRYFLTPSDKCTEGTSNDSRITSSVFAPHAKTRVDGTNGSCFYSRDRSCSLVARDPLSLNMEGRGPIDNTLEFMSSDGHVNLHAQIVSAGEEAIDPAQLTLIQMLPHLLILWRNKITPQVWTARKAVARFFQWKHNMWCCPGLSNQNASRSATQTERELEYIFRKYLRYLIKQSSSSLSVRYISDALPVAVDEQMLSIMAEKEPDSVEHLEFKVLTPAFYPRFVHYAHDFEAIFCELNDHHTIWLSNPALLPRLVLKKPPPILTTESYLDYGCFTVIKKLRRLPEKIKRPPVSSRATTMQSLGDIRRFRLSSMDGYVLSHEDDKTRCLYRKIVLKLFIADRIAWGGMGMLQLLILLFRLLLAWIIVSPP